MDPPSTCKMRYLNSLRSAERSDEYTAERAERAQLSSQLNVWREGSVFGLAWRLAWRSAKR